MRVDDAGNENILVVMKGSLPAVLAVFTREGADDGCGRDGAGAADSLPAATLGPLIHNPQFTEALKQKGILCKESLEEVVPISLENTSKYSNEGVSRSL